MKNASKLHIEYVTKEMIETCCDVSRSVDVLGHYSSPWNLLFNENRIMQKLAISLLDYAKKIDALERTWPVFHSNNFGTKIRNFLSLQLMIFVTTNSCSLLMSVQAYFSTLLHRLWQNKVNVLVFLVLPLKIIVDICVIYVCRNSVRVPACHIC